MNKLIIALSFLLSFSNSITGQTYLIRDNIEATQSFTLFGKKVTLISTDFTAASKNDNYLITERAAKLYADGISNSGWKLLGNSGTIDGTNFIGTIDNVPINFRVNNQKAGRIESNPVTASTFLGYQAGNITNGLNPPQMAVAIGYNSMFGNVNSTGLNNTAVGANTLYSNTSGSDNTAIGKDALLANTTGAYNIGIGVEALRLNTQGSYNVATGKYSLFSNLIGNANVSNGHASLYSNTTGSFNTAIGEHALGLNINGSENTGIGYLSSTASALNNATAVGARSIVTKNNSMVLGSITGFNGATANTNIGIGTTAPDTTLHVLGKFKYQDGSQSNGRILQSDANGNATWVDNSSLIANAWSITGNSGTNSAINFLGTTDNQALIFKVNNFQSGKIDHINSNLLFGYRAGENITTSSANTVFGNFAMPNNSGLGAGGNTVFGYGAMASNTNSINNVAVGDRVLESSTTGQYNTAVGSQAMLSNTFGARNVAIGYQTLNNNTFGSQNIAIGYQSLFNNVGTSNNIAIGHTTLTQTIGNSNIGLGAGAGNTNTTGTNNIFIGESSNSLFGNLTRAGAIGYNSRVGISNAISYGDTTQNIFHGFGTAYPTERVDIRGSLKIVDGTQGAGKILQSDANGKSSWVTASALVPLTNTQIAYGSTGNTVTSSSDFTYNVTGINKLFTVGFAGSVSLRLDKGILGGAYSMGEISGTHNNTIITVDDPNKSFSFSSGGKSYLGLDANNRTYTIGDYMAGGNSTFLTVDDQQQMLALGSGGTNIITVDALNNTTRFGPLAGTMKFGFNKTAAEVLDVQGNVRFSGALMPNGLAGTSGQILQTNGAGVPPTWVTTSSITAPSNNTSSAGTLSLVASNNYVYYTFTGSTTTWTMPAIAGNTGVRITVINMGSGNITLNSNAGGSDIWESGSNFSTRTINSGQFSQYYNNGTKWVTL